jgi:uncharacterized 2Fe-2S/4Fe-4S cluster protein (DUF4445 family)
MRRLILEQLQKVLAQAGERCRVAIAANTTMLHLLNGWDCSGLGAAPFQPVSLAMRREQWTTPAGTAEVTQLPGISAFVGADIVSGIYALNLNKEEHPVLFIDLGTNGEMALGCRERLLVASTAAGPAFEGSELAMQLHGAGILNCLHRMLDEGVLDETGLLSDAYFQNGYPAAEHMAMTQDDIREIQLAKAAIRAGITVLLKEYGITETEVSHVYLAGGMGYYLDPEDAVAVGLIPQEFETKTKAVSNTSLQGAMKYLCADAESAECELGEICKKAEKIVLAEHPLFEELYINHMSF